jgi:8-hydroxy-5-deazaflavin:NADPH oxidoreductase
MMQAASVKSVGIIGAGRIGQAVARIASRAGRPVVIANREGPESLARVVAELGDGVSAGTVSEAAAREIVVIAVMWPDVPQAVGGVAWKNQIVIDPTNAFDPAGLDGRTSSELVAELVAPARVVKAANTLGADVLASDPKESGGRRALFMSGDDADAKTDVASLFEDAGFSVVDLGALREGAMMQQFGGPLAGENLILLA